MEANSTYQDFIYALRKVVGDYFTGQKKIKKADTWFFVKASIYLTTFVTSYFLLFHTSSLPVFTAIYLFHGLNGFFLNLNVSHDAAHNAVFKNPRHNRLLYYICFIFLGNSAWIWKKSHCEYHHKAPNVTGKDPDLIETPLIRMFSHQKYRWFHRFQVFYAPILYMLHAPVYYLLTEPMLIFLHKGMSQKDKTIAFSAKAIHLIYLLILPVLLSPFPFLPVFILFILVQMGISLVLVLALGVIHLNDQAKFYPDMSSESPIAIQLHSSLDYGGHCKFTHFIAGGFNLHGLHHLLPDVCHTHYINLIVPFKSIAEKHKIPYKTVSYHEILKSHFRLLYKMSQNTST